MRKMRSAIRRLGYAAMVMALAGGLALPAAADTTLRLVSWQVEDPAFGPWWRSVIAEFEKRHSGVKVEFTSVPRESFADQMTTLFASGSPPQIVHLASFEFQAFADNGWLEPLDSYVEESGLDPAIYSDFTFFEGAGCIECNGTGFLGRVAVSELLDLSDHIRELILARRPGSEIKRAAKEEGMVFLRESALEKVFQGVTTLREINKVTFVD